MFFEIVRLQSGRFANFSQHSLVLWELGVELSNSLNASSFDHAIRVCLCRRLKVMWAVDSFVVVYCAAEVIKCIAALCRGFISSSSSMEMSVKCCCDSFLCVMLAKHSFSF